MGSVGQRASKLLAVKVGGLKKKSAIRPRPLSNQSAQIRVVPGSNHSQSLLAGHFAALWPTDPKFSALKDLNPSSTVSKIKKAGSILKVVFALSKWPHLHSAYLVTVCRVLITTVHWLYPCGAIKHMLLNIFLFCSYWWSSMLYRRGGQDNRYVQRVGRLQDLFHQI